MLQTAFNWQITNSSGIITSNATASYSALIESLGFTPNFIVPDGVLASAELVQLAKKNNFKLVPQVVDIERDILAMKVLGTNGVITASVDTAMTLYKNGIV